LFNACWSIRTVNPAHGCTIRGRPRKADSRSSDARRGSSVRRGRCDMAFEIEVNGVKRAADVDGDTPLLWVLRDVLGMTGTKFGCGKALCGACTVPIDGNATRSCITPIDSIGTSKVTTIEAIGATPIGASVQKAWLAHEVPQCGYCQSGQIMS